MQPLEVLVLGDDEATRPGVARALARLGHAVAEVRREDAADIAAGHGYDVVVLDRPAPGTISRLHPEVDGPLLVMIDHPDDVPGPTRVRMVLVADRDRDRDYARALRMCAALRRPAA
jgi:CheY-like chemotaxis protein